MGEERFAAGDWSSDGVELDVVQEGVMTARFYGTTDGRVVVADQAGWLPGSFPSKDAALEAVRKVNGLRGESS